MGIGTNVLSYGNIDVDDAVEMSLTKVICTFNCRS